MSYIIIDTAANQDRANELLDTSFADTVLAGTPEDDDSYASGVVVKDRETFTATDLPDPDDEASNGSSTLRLYRLDGATVIIETGDNDGLGIFAPGATILDYLNDWDFGDVDRATGLAEFGFDAGPEEADETDTDVRIWKRPNYYAGTLGAPHADYVREDTWERDPVVFATYDDAKAWIDDAESGIYCTAHGEAGRPDYIIVK